MIGELAAVSTGLYRRSQGWGQIGPSLLLSRLLLHQGASAGQGVTVIVQP